jgi:hypothetical protein
LFSYFLYRNNNSRESINNIFKKKGKDMDLKHLKVRGSRTPIFLSLHDIKNVDIKGGVVTREIIEGVTVTSYSNGNIISWEPEYPRYCSWKGFDGWCDTIQKAFNLDYVTAYVIMLQPEKDIDWVLNLEKHIVEMIYSNITPFNNLTLDREVIDYWRQNGEEQLCSLKDALKYGKILVHCRPKNNVEFRRCRYMLCSDIPNEINATYLRLWRDIGGLKRSPEELLIFARMGIVSPKLVRLFKKYVKNIYTMEAYLKILLQNMWLNSEFFVVMKKFHQYVDEKFFDGFLTVGSLIKAGVPTKEIFPDLTGKEVAVILNDLENCEVHNINYRVVPAYIRCFIKNIPEAWYPEIHSLPVAKWAGRHINILSKSRVIHGPAGAMATIHYHQLLREITPDMLVNGEKTSWKIVTLELQKIAEDRIRAQLGENVKLPIIKHSTVPQCKRIETSRELLAEGESMSHCVGGYINSCLAKQSFIYHIGPPAPQGGTLEVCLDGYKKYKMNQLYGIDNKPIPHLEPICEKLLKVINK